MAVSKVTSTTCAPRSFTSNWPREKGPAFVGGAKEIVMQRGRLGGIPLPRDRFLFLEGGTEYEYEAKRPFCVRESANRRNAQSAKGTSGNI